MENLFAKVTGIIIGVVSTVSTAVGQPMATPTPVPTPVPSVVIVSPNDYQSLNGSYNLAGKNIQYSVKIPKNNGPITGDISGDCQATINGQKENNQIYGDVSGNCSLGLIKPPVKASFNGDIVNQQVNINYQVQSPVNYSGSTKIGL